LRERRPAQARKPLTDMQLTEQDHFLHPKQGSLVIYYPVSQ
jgi:hypothetical protein